MKMGKLGVALVAMAGVSVLALAGCGASSFTKGAKVEFTGYQGKGEAGLKDNALDTWKEIASYEGKKAKVENKTMKALVEKADSVNDLTDTDNFSVGMSSEQSINVSAYLDHMDKTSVGFENSSDLKNGDKVKLVIEDSSTKPYFKKVEKEYTVKGLKKMKQLSIASLVKDLSVVKNSTNHYAAADIEYTGKEKIDAYSLTHQLSNYNKTVSNGDVLTSSKTEAEIAKELNNRNSSAQFTGRKGKKVSFTVSGLKSDTPRPSNMDEVIALVRKASTKKKDPSDYHITPAHQKDVATGKVLSAVATSTGFYITFQGTDNYRVTAETAKPTYKNGALYFNDKKVTSKSEDPGIDWTETNDKSKSYLPETNEPQKEPIYNFKL